MTNKTEISLKKIEEKAPQLISLAKTATISLKKLNLDNVTARVVLVLDASGSMNQRYQTGVVQEIVNRTLPLAVNFDDDAAIECYAFAQKPCQLPDVDLNNFQDAIGDKWREWPVGARINNEIDTMKLVVGDALKAESDYPTYVIFISDGGVGSANSMKNLMKEISDKPVFWQFMGIGGRDYGALEKLDEMSGRVVDNANFFKVDTLNDMSESELYDALLGEFPDWLAEAKKAGILLEDGKVDKSRLPAPASTTEAEPQAKKGFFSRIFGG